MTVLLIVIFFFLGVIVGRFVSINPKLDGLFIIDDSGEKTKWNLDVKFDPDDIFKHKYLLFKVCKMEENKAHHNIE